MIFFTIYSRSLSKDDILEILDGVFLGEGGIGGGGFDFAGGFRLSSLSSSWEYEISSFESSNPPGLEPRKALEYAAVASPVVPWYSLDDVV